MPNPDNALDLYGSILLLAPELALAVGAMVLLMVGAFTGDRVFRSLSYAAIVLMAGAAVAIALQPQETLVAFNGAFIVDTFARFMKILVLLGAMATLAMSLDFLGRERIARFEIPVLVVIATLGMLMMISANDFIALYVGLELQSLPLYVLAAINRDSLRSSEAGLKYFVLGALSSGLLLYGCSLIYGATGTTSFSVMAERGLAEGMEPALAVGLAFLLAGLGFKVSAAPFHMWTPDVYEGAPTPITALFAAAPKVAAMALFIRALQGPLPAFQDTWSDIVVILAVLSMGIGAFAAIGQQNIKRLMAYSSIGHVGFALVGLAAGTEEGVRGVLIYMAIYMVTNLGAFVCILAMRRPEGMVEQISDLAGLGRNQPGLAFALAAIMFSLAGIPPLAGFFGKFFVFLAAVQAGMTWLAVIGVLLSVVGAYYYLRIVKLMYFDEPAERFVQPIGFANQSILVLSGAFTLLFIAFAAFLIPVADTAACSLFHADVSTCSLLVREDIAAAP